TAVAYPNPFANSFLLDVKTSNNTPVFITVYDMLGRLVEQQQANVTELETTTIGSNYPSGVYNVIITQADETRAVRVVKR
ncbi:MAG: T9SS type A sorting domain-containing protein, partial [Bacteroidetes bacterium]|nr:T9SS type A sorting domain-containing protein [Bacteroidota bacterium]